MAGGTAAASTATTAATNVRRAKASGIIDEVLLQRIVAVFACSVVLTAAGLAVNVGQALSAQATEVKKPDATAASATDGTPDVLVSRQLMARAGLTIGEVVTISADPAGKRAARFRVAGVYEPTPDPMKFNVERLETRLHLDDLLSLTADPSDPTSNDSVTSINVSVRRSGRRRRVVRHAGGSPSVSRARARPPDRKARPSP